MRSRRSPREYEVYKMDLGTSQSGMYWSLIKDFMPMARSQKEAIWLARAFIGRGTYQAKEKK
jgi:hypothetical protein